MPITNDREMIRHFLDALDEKVMPISGKLPETIIPLTKKLLSKSTVPGTLLLVGDGATSNTVSAFKNFFNEQAAQLLVWGIGNSAQTNETDKVKGIDTTAYTIPLQLEQLKALSNESHGRLILMSNDASDVKRINTYIKHNLVIVDDNSRPWHDSGYPMLFIVAGIFLFWFRKGWTLQW
jgi:Ca-activated chloride channel family protein